ncbi:MAG: preprotein translocase subunit SecY [Chthonomonas sp.]|nr:preprotein translocase subunit SecY [Chthonomonas sp.]
MSFMGGGDFSGGGDKSLKMSLADTVRLAWADPDLRSRLKFVFFIFAVYALGIHIQVPIPGVDPAQLERLLQSNQFLNLVNAMGGGGLRKISIFALALNPYITASIIMQVLQSAFPAFKQEMKEGGEYARKQMNKRTRMLALLLCGFQGWGLLQLIKQTGSIPASSQTVPMFLMVIAFWTAGSMFLLWLGEQVSERGIGNGVSILIFAGIIISFPYYAGQVAFGVQTGTTSIFQVVLVMLMFALMTWFVVLFTIAQRRIPIQHMRRQMGTKALGGQTSYLPFSLNMVGVIPIIFAVSLVYMPQQFASMIPVGAPMHNFFEGLAKFTTPNLHTWTGVAGVFFYMALIFFFTYFYTAIQFNVEDIADNLKRGGSFIPGIRPGKQTKDFLDSVISRITFIGALFLSIVSVNQYLVPLLINIQQIQLIFGTSLLIMVSVALETMRQIEANLLMKQYGQ